MGSCKVRGVLPALALLMWVEAATAVVVRPWGSCLEGQEGKAVVQAFHNCSWCLISSATPAQSCASTDQSQSLPRKRYDPVHVIPSPPPSRYTAGPGSPLQAELWVSAAGRALPAVAKTPGQKSTWS